MKFDAPATIPGGGELISARLVAQVADDPRPCDYPLFVHRIASPWTLAANWSTSDGTTAWRAAISSSMQAIP